MSELYHECGIVAVYHLPNRGTSRFIPKQGLNETSRLIPRLLLDVQNRGQLAAGMTSFNSSNRQATTASGGQLINTHKDVGTVTEVFRLNHQGKAESLMRKYAGSAAIGHVRYATCGQDDRSYAQPFEREHIEKSKWFSFAFNGQLANYPQLRDEILSKPNFHIARETDTEILQHLLCQELAAEKRPALLDVLGRLSERLDGAYNLIFLNALGDMFVARDPLGIRPLCYAIDESKFFAAASESVALANLGFEESDIKSLPPGCAVVIENGKLEIKQFVAKPQRAHCFFEWIYFANVASTIDDKSVYLTRKTFGRRAGEARNGSARLGDNCSPGARHGESGRRQHGVSIESAVA